MACQRRHGVVTCSVDGVIIAGSWRSASKAWISAPGCGQRLAAKGRRCSGRDEVADAAPGSERAPGSVGRPSRTCQRATSVTTRCW